MLALSGKCTRCRKLITILEPGIVCFHCEKYRHGTCLVPPHDMAMLIKCVLSKNGWLCSYCWDNVKRRISWARTDEEIAKIKEKVDIIVEVRELLALIEAALRSMSAKCNELNDLAVSYREQNKYMKERIKHYENYRKPKNFREWQKGRTDLKVGQQLMRRKPVRKTKDAKEAAQRKKELEKHLKKEHNFKHLKKQKSQKIERVKTKTTGKLVYIANRIYSKTWLMQILLFFTMIAYTFVGAFVFTIIEGRYEEKLVHEIIMERQRLLKNFSSETLSTYYDFLAEKYGKHNQLLTRGEGELNWNFVGSLFFCGTTYTTIGYGNLAPVTNEGKIFTMIYALIGIPLFLVFLASFGKTILKVLEWNFSLIELCKCKKTQTDEDYYETETDEPEKPPDVPLWHMMILALVLILVGTLIFFLGEGLYINESVYFIFVTLYTIGFGDIYPTNRSYMLICVLYIIIGLIFASTAISLIAETIKVKVSMASKKLGNKIDQYTAT